MPITNINLSRAVKDRSLWVAVSVSSVVLSILFIEPFSFDNALYTTMASDLLRQGRIPYLGSFDQNFPGIILIHVAAVALFGSSDLGLRCFDFCIQIGFVVFFYKFLSRYLPDRTAALAVILYVFYYVGAGTNMYAQRDVYTTMCVMAALALLLRPLQRTSRTIIAAGLWNGASILLRPTSLLFLACAAVYLLVNNELRPPLRNIPQVFLLVLTGLLPISIVLLYYATIPGGLEAFYTSTIRFNLEIYSRMHTMTSFWLEFGRTGLIPVFAAIGLIAKHRANTNERRLSRREFFFATSLVISSFLIIVVMQKSFRYHFAPVMIGLIPLAAIGIERSVSAISRKVFRRAIVFGLLLLCTFPGYRIQGPIRFISGLVSGADPFERVYEVRNQDSQFGAAKEYTLRAFLNRADNQKGSIELCSYDPRARAHLQRTFASAFASYHEIAPLVNSSSESSYNYTDFQLRWRHQYIQSLETIQPRFIVLSREMTFWDHPVLYEGVLHTLPGFDSLLTTHYNLDTIIGGYEVYQWKQHQ